MNEPKPDPPPVEAHEPQIIPRKKRGIPLVWFVPIVAAMIGGWLIYDTIMGKGPEITIYFDTAVGLEAGKTKIKHRNVEVGTVVAVSLADDLSRVVVTGALVKEAKPQLRSNTRFWVVRPRIGAQGISGLSTLMSGAYIEMEPGPGVKRSQFTGLENPPISPADAPGLKIIIETDKLRSIAAGSPIYYKGIQVGEIEAKRFSSEKDRILLDAFIPEEHQALVRHNTRFWDASGLDVLLGADGLEVRTESLEAIIMGGVAFETPTPAEEAAQSGDSFQLYGSYRKVQESLIREQGDRYTFVLYFEESVRGLQKGAPVTFRGVRLGEVVDLRIEFDSQQAMAHIPVHVEINTARFTRVSEKRDPTETLRDLVRQGLRARLETGSLLTGAKLIDLDFYPETPIRLLGRDADLPEMPTTLGTFAALTRKVEDLDVDQVVSHAVGLLSGAETLVNAPETKGSIVELNGLLTSLREKSPALLENLDKSVVQLQRTLVELEGMVRKESELRYLLTDALRQVGEGFRAVRQLADTLEREPNSVIFGKSAGGK